MPYLISPYKAAKESSIEELVTKINARLDRIEERMRIGESDRVDTKSTESRTEWDI